MFGGATKAVMPVAMMTPVTPAINNASIVVNFVGVPVCMDGLGDLNLNKLIVIAIITINQNKVNPVAVNED